MVEYANQPTTSTYAAGEDKTADVIELLQNLDPVGGQETTLLIPDELTRHVLAKAGVTCEDVRTLRLFSLAGQMFLNDIVDEACVVQQNRMQAPLKFQQNEGYPTKDRRPVVLTEDVAVAAREYGMKVYRPQFLNQ
ncbi:hypothetical protein M9434_001006 [Picochlorum sp. BPE23]|nr:hypothetical protein M9434_001006 [Picochlorum sp. BPE23]KAI8111748.1 hypothetical protein M9435_004247 [Picochlorum sp. BPE23]